MKVRSKEGPVVRPEVNYTPEPPISQEELQANLCNPPKPGCPDYTEPVSNEEEIQEAGFGKVPIAVWIVMGAGVVYFIGKKQKWF